MKILLIVFLNILSFCAIGQMSLDQQLDSLEEEASAMKKDIEKRQESLKKIIGEINVLQNEKNLKKVSAKEKKSNSSDQSKFRNIALGVDYEWAYGLSLADASYVFPNNAEENHVIRVPEYNNNEKDISRLSSYKFRESNDILVRITDEYKIRKNRHYGYYQVKEWLTELKKILDDEFGFSDPENELLYLLNDRDVWVKELNKGEVFYASYQYRSTNKVTRLEARATNNLIYIRVKHILIKTIKNEDAILNKIEENNPNAIEKIKILLAREVEWREIREQNEAETEAAERERQEKLRADRLEVIKRAEAKKEKEEAKEKKRKSDIIATYGKEVGQKLIDGYYWIGMTDEMARLSLGYPKDVNRTVGSWGTHEQWVYSMDLMLYFENGILKSYQN